TALAEAGGLADTPVGRKQYADFLDWQATEGPVGKSKAYVSLSKGWAIGSAGFKTTLIKDHALTATSRAWESQGAMEIKQQAWEEFFLMGLKIVGRKEDDLADGPQSVDWKVALAVFMKERTQVSNPWLAARLKISSPMYLSRLVSTARRLTHPADDLTRLRARCRA
ncbi:MAG: hypothetical protein ABI273_04070, partial [Lacunisphaera sp.]